LQVIFVGYFLMAIPAGQIMRWFGYKTGLITGLILMEADAGCLSRGACRGVWIFSGSAVCDWLAGSLFWKPAQTSFIAQLGPAGSSERRLNLSQAFIRWGPSARD